MCQSEPIFILNSWLLRNKFLGLFGTSHGQYSPDFSLLEWISVLSLFDFRLPVVPCSLNFFTYKWIIFLCGTYLHQNCVLETLWTIANNSYVVRCAIWYHLYNLTNVKNTHGRLLILACNFTKISTPPWVFFTFFKLRKWYQIAQRTTYEIFFNWISSVLWLYCPQCQNCIK